MNPENELTALTYEQLEKLSEQILTQLSDSSLPLDKASALYKRGKAVSKEMEARLAALEKTVTDEIK